MKIAVFDTHKFERPYFEDLNSSFGFDISFFDYRLNADTAKTAEGFECVCVFVNDRVDANVVARLKEHGVKLIALRSAGFNNVDLKACGAAGIAVVRVPAYSPHAVAEHAVTLMMTLNRKIHRAYARVRELNFSLDGLVGFDFYGKTVGIIGTGKIGSVVANIMKGFGCNVIAYDLEKSCDVSYVDLKELYSKSDIISLHVPLNTSTHHMIDETAFAQMKPGVMLINTGRGALIRADHLISALKKGIVGTAGLDVYEEEENVFFQDLSGTVLKDDVLARLLTFPNVVITAHQGFLTQEALHNIVETTLQNISDFHTGKPAKNALTFS